MKAHLAHEVRSICLLPSISLYLLLEMGGDRGQIHSCFIKSERWFSTVVGRVAHVIGY